MKQADLIHNVIETEQRTKLISKIVEAEHHAEMISREALEQQAALEEELLAEEQKMREYYKDKAQKKIDEFAAEETEKAAAAIKELDERLQRKLMQVENIYAEKRDQWIEAIFGLVVGR